MEISLEAKVNIYTEWLLERKAENVLAIDVREKCSFTEFIIVCTGTSIIHNKAIADYILDKSYQNKIQVLGKEGAEALTWILIDLNDLIIHIFTEETLNMYNLEDLWTKKNINQDNNYENKR